MTIINKITREEQDAYIKRKDKPNITNIRIIKKIYRQYDTLEQLIADEKFMQKIVKNGYYKAAVCDRFDIQAMEIILEDGTQHTFLALGKHNILKLVKNELKVKPVDIDYIDTNIDEVIENGNSEGYTDKT